MRALTVFAAVVCSAGAFGQLASGGYGANSVYNKLWTASKVVTVNGTVTGRLVNPPLKGMENSVSLMLKQADSEPFEVQLGPEWFVSRMPVQIKVGDKVVVAGSRVLLDGRSVIMAESVTKGKSEVLFRNRNGTPRWMGVMLQSLPTDVPVTSGTLLATETTMIDGVEHQLFRVETEDGTIDIVGAPLWYANRQNYRLDVGSGISIVGPTRVLQAGRSLFLADSLYSAGSTFVLNPFGVWRY